MKHFIILTLVLGLAACQAPVYNNDTDPGVKRALQQALKKAQEKTSDAMEMAEGTMDAAKETAEGALEMAGEAGEMAGEMAEGTMDAAKATAEDALEMAGEAMEELAPDAPLPDVTPEPEFDADGFPAN